MNLQQLKQLAEAVESAPLAHRIDAFCRAANPDTILQMIALIELQHEALEKVKNDDQVIGRWTYSEIKAALTAYKEFGK